MKIPLTVSALTIVLATAPVASATAAPGVRLLSGPAFHQPWQVGERHALWRTGDHDGDRDFWRHRHRHDFFGPVGPIVGEASEPGAEAAPAPFVVSAPVFVNVTIAPAGEPTRQWTAGPKLIEIGRTSPPRRPLPLVVYGD
jgi:hypothetical protein